MKKYYVPLMLLFIVSCGQVVQEIKKSDQTAVKTTGITNLQENKITSNTIQTQINNIQAQIKSFEIKIIGGREAIEVGEARFWNVRIDPQLAKEKTDCYIIEASNIDKEYLQYLKQNQVQVGYYIPQNSLVVRSKKGPAEIKRLRNVKNIENYQPFLKIAKSDGELGNIRKARVTLWEGVPAKNINELCQKNNIKIVSSAGSDFVVEGNDLKPLVMDENVLRLEKYYEPLLFTLSGSDIANVIAPASLYPVGGSTVSVSVMDVGIDLTHPDLKGAVAEALDTAGDGDAGELTSHGTHIAGIIAGRGVVSGGKVNGINPEAKLFFYSMGDNLKGLVIPASMSNYLDHSYRKGSYIANMSWGTYDGAASGNYLSISRDIDAYVFNHPEMLVVVAAGNDGKSIASPATAKNIISVGALDGAGAASFSGRNGCSDGRVKPDIMLQGSGIQSLELNGGYTSESGTSQAAGILSGLISRLYSAIGNTFHIKPTHSVIKSLLIANTLEDKPSADMGYGRLFFDGALDRSHFDIRKFSGIRQDQEIDYTLAAGDRAVFVLSWTEPPAYEGSFFQLVDDYDLSVVTPLGEVVTLNDHRNNVEKIVISAAVSGKYRVIIKAARVPIPTGDIALAAKSASGFQKAEAGNGNDSSQDVQLDTNASSTANLSVSEVQFQSGQSGVNQDGSTASVETTYQLNGTSVLAPMVSSSLSTPSSTGGNASKSTSSPMDALAELSSSNNMNAVQVIVLYYKPGNNSYLFRALGSVSNETVGLSFVINSNQTAEQVMPLYTFITNDYRQFGINLPYQDGGIIGILKVRESGNGVTNTSSVQFQADTNTPAFGGSWPVEGGILTNQEPWIILTDSQSGVDTNFSVSVNGVFLTNQEYHYTPADGKIAFSMNKITTNFGTIHVKFFNVGDIVGNILPEKDWNFLYSASNDTTPPDKPAGLTAYATNKTVIVNWLSNTEKDLAGYKIYQMSRDGLEKNCISGSWVLTDYYQFQSKDIDVLGVSAVDVSSNESDIAMAVLNYQYQDQLPVIVIESVPGKTNASVPLKFQIIEESAILITNILLNSGNIDIQWVSNWGYALAAQNGSNHFEIEVMDDDSNWTANSVDFVVDRDAPDAPGDLAVSYSGKDVLLRWNNVVKNGVPCTYRVGVNSQYMESNWTSTNYSVLFSNYGRNSVFVSAVDDAGNESEKSYVLADTAKGIGMILDTTNTRGSVNGQAELMVSTNSYTLARFQISNRSKTMTWYEVPAFEIGIHRNISEMPDGSYYLSLTLFSNSRPVLSDKGNYQTNIMIDQTPPVVLWQNGVQTVSGNYLVTREQSVTAVINDASFQEADFSGGGGNTALYLTNQIVIPLTNYQELNLSTRDTAGNVTTAQLTVVQDKEPPVLRIEGLDGSIYGNISDPDFKDFQVYTNGSLYYESDSEADGWICYQPLQTGTITIKAFDQAGNMIMFQTNIFNTKKNTDPELTITMNGGTNYYQNSSDIDVIIPGDWTNIYPFIFTLYSGSNQSVMTSGPVYSSECNFSGMKDGNYSVGVARKTKSAAMGFVVDTTAPVITLASSPIESAVLSNILAIKEANLDQTKIILDGKTADLGDMVAGGIHQLQVTARDKAGNVSTVNNQLTVIGYRTNYQTDLFNGLTDDKHPVTAELSPVDQLTVIGYRTNYQTASFDGLTDEGFYNHPVTVTLTDPVSRLRVKVNGIENGNGINREGQYHIEAVGETGGLTETVYTNAINITLDFTPPAISTALADGGYYVRLPELLVDDMNLDTVVKTVDGRVWKGEALADGPHALAVTAGDKAGNRSQWNYHFVLDTVLPEITIQPAGGIYSNIKPIINVMDKNQGSTVCYINGRQVTNLGTLNVEGNYEIDAVSVDLAGNSSSASMKYSIDQMPPQISLNMVNGICYATNSALIASSIDTHSGTVGITMDGANYTGGMITAEGNHSAVITAIDLAGNTTVSNLNFDVSANVPNILISGLEGLPVDGAGTYYSDSERILSASLSAGTPVSLEFTLNGTNTGQQADMNDDGDYQAQVLIGMMYGTNLYHLLRTEHVIVDRSGPVINVQNVSDRSINIRPLSIAVTAGDHLAAQSVTLNGSPAGNQINISSDGNYVLSVNVKDWLGRASTQSYGFTLDQSGAQVAVTGVADSGKYSEAVNYSLGSNNPYIRSLRAVLNGQSVPLNGVFNTYGNNVLDYQAEDYAGNVFNWTIRFLIDNANPQITLAGLTNQMSVKNLSAAVNLSDEFMRGYGVWISGDGGYTNQFSGVETNAAIGLGFLNLEQNYTLTAQAMDLVGNITYTNIGFSIDRTPPQIGVRGIHQNEYYSGPVNVYVNDSDRHGFVKTVNLDGSSYSLTPNTTSFFAVTNDGVHQLDVNVIDRAGNVSGTNLIFTIDKTQPMIAITGVNDGGRYNGSRTVSVQVSDINYSNAVVIDSMTVSGSATNIVRSLNFTASEDGTHNVSVTAWDLAGNSRTTNISFLVNQTPPSIHVLGISNGEYTNKSEVTLAVTSTSLYPGVTQAWLDGNPQPDIGNITASGDRQHVLIVYSKDQVNNESYLTNRFTIDTTLPALSVSGVSDGSYYNTDRPVTVTISDANIDTSQSKVSNDGTEKDIAAGSGTLTASFTESGEMTFHSLSIHGQDLAGNVSNWTLGYSVDKTLPVVSISNVAEGSFVQSAQPVVYAAKNPGSSGLKSISLLTNGVSFGNISISSFQNYQTNLSYNYNSEGSYHFGAFANDYANNVSVTNFVNFTVDAHGPGITVQSRTSGSFSNGILSPDPTFNETLEIKISVTDNYCLEGIDVYDTGNNLIAQVSGIHDLSGDVVLTRDYNIDGFGTKNLRVVAYDAAGNTNVQTPPLSYFFKDLTAPAVRAIRANNVSQYFHKIIDKSWGDGVDYSVDIEITDKFGVTDNWTIDAPGVTYEKLAESTSTRQVYRFFLTASAGQDVLRTITLIPKDLSDITLNGGAGVSYQFRVDKKAPHSNPASQWDDFILDLEDCTDENGILSANLHFMERLYTPQNVYGPPTFIYSGPTTVTWNNVSSITYIYWPPCCNIGGGVLAFKDAAFTATDYFGNTYSFSYDPSYPLSVTLKIEAVLPRNDIMTNITNLEP